jgi:hypothetical protein
MLVGTTRRGPSHTKVNLPGASETYIDFPVDENPWAMCDRKWDFDQRIDTYTLSTTITDNVSNAGLNILPGANTNTAIGYCIVPRDGYLVSAKLVAQDTLAANDTNYQTFSLTNKLGAGAGSTAMLAATDANTTKATGGSALTAQVPRSLTLNGTAANLRVNAGDLLLFTATATQSPTVSDAPTLLLEIATIPTDLTPIIQRTAGSPLIAPVANTKNGEIAATLEATNEAQTAGWNYGDQVIIPATKGFIFEALVKFAAHSTNERAVVGMASAHNATLDSVVSNAWFRLEASLALLAETDDGTTDNDDQSCAKTLTAATYYYLRIDGSRQKAVKFWVNNQLVKTLAAAAWAVTDLLQPVILTQKASGTGVPSVTCDFMRLRWNRF